MCNYNKQCSSVDVLYHVSHFLLNKFAEQSCTGCTTWQQPDVKCKADELPRGQSIATCQLIKICLLRDNHDYYHHHLVSHALNSKIGPQIPVRFLKRGVAGSSERVMKRPRFTRMAVGFVRTSNAPFNVRKFSEADKDTFNF